ncbi:hypothetical protein BSM64_004001 [Salmonella enterica subsp. enterica serovar Miami]|nr:hypothetical protein [Salmonella enterica subsp. enterica serovar Miami]NPR57169.1 hypothetical protein [Escherichia coli]
MAFMVFIDMPVSFSAERRHNRHYHLEIFMTHDEEVLFLFAQTCSILTGKAPVASNSRIEEVKFRVGGPYSGLSDDFDQVYSILEEKLKQKLQN